MRLKLTIKPLVLKNMHSIKIGLIGDYNPGVKAHMAIPEALKLVSEEIQISVEHNWLSTESLATNHQEQLKVFDGLWCVPGSPYKSMQGALNGIRFARENKIPFLGTCGGFQHAVIEYVRNVLGMKEADHEETNPDAEFKIISPLSCSLVEKRGGIRFKAGSKIAGIYDTTETIEEYHCNYGINPIYKKIFVQRSSDSVESAGLYETPFGEDGNISITGFDNDGDARVIEIFSHPLFIATLYQPERSAFSGKSHPLIKAFVTASCNHIKEDRI